MQVLVIDDDAAVCASIRDVLAAEGYTTRIALSAAEALGIRDVPSLIILDLNLGNYDGEDVAKLLLPKLGQSVPIIALSADSRAHERIARLPGTVALLRKPFDLDELLSIVKALVSIKMKPG